jgi:glycine dehydrogenase subunit 1
MGPQGMHELGEGIMARARYAALQLDRIPGVRAPVFQAPFYQEFVVDLNGTGRTVSEINRALLQKGILGGKDLSGEFPKLGQCALFCVSEVHTQQDIDRLAYSLKEVMS